MTTTQLTPASLATFLTYARDAANWSGTPWVSDGNVTCTKEMRGNLSDLVQKGLLTIDYYADGRKQQAYITFTDAGRSLAAENGVEVE